MTTQYELPDASPIACYGDPAADALRLARMAANSSGKALRGCMADARKAASVYSGYHVSSLADGLLENLAEFEFSGGFPKALTNYQEYIAWLISADAFDPPMPASVIQSLQALAKSMADHAECLSRLIVAERAAVGGKGVGL